MIAVAYQKWSFMRGSNYKALTRKLWEVNRTAQSTLALRASPGRCNGQQLNHTDVNLSHVK